MPLLLEARASLRKHMNGEIVSKTYFVATIREISFAAKSEWISNLSARLLSEVILSPDGIEATLMGSLEGQHDFSVFTCLLYTSPSPRDRQKSRMPSSA